MLISKCCKEPVETKVKGFFHTYNITICTCCTKQNCGVEDLSELLNKKNKKIWEQRKQLKSLNKAYILMKSQKILKGFKSLNVHIERAEIKPATKETADKFDQDFMALAKAEGVDKVGILATEDFVTMVNRDPSKKI